MSEEEKEAIERLKILECDCTYFENGKCTYSKNKCQREQDIETALNLIQKQQEEIEKLRNKNKDLLRKLRNRVKEVKKLTKYSLYKEEFSRLNARIQKKDKIIDLMAHYIWQYDCCEYEIGKNEKCQGYYLDKDCKNNCIKQYFESKV